jgi:hypothetical protein
LGSITRILSGHAVLTDRFIKTVCAAFGIHIEWINNGVEPIINNAKLMEMLKAECDALGIKPYASANKPPQAMTAAQMRAKADELEKESLETANELDKFFDSVNENRVKNIDYMKGLIERLNNDEFTSVEEFIFDLFRKRK